MTLVLPVLFLIELIFSIKYIKSNNMKNYHIVLGTNLSSILALISMILYGIMRIEESFPLKYLTTFIRITLPTILANIILLVLIFIVYCVFQEKKKNIRIETKTSKKYFILPFVIIILFTAISCLNFEGVIKLQRKIVTDKYNKTKDKQITQMKDYLNEKYDLTLKQEDCFFYRPEDYTFHGDIFGNGQYYNIPYITAFTYNKTNKPIVVTNRLGFISDNYQLSDINYLISDYFSKKTGETIEYVEIRYAWNGNLPDDRINEVLQNRFNQKLDENNIKELIDELLSAEDLEINMYVESNKVNIDNLKTNIEYLTKIHDIRILNIIVFENELVVDYKESELTAAHEKYAISADISDSYKYGYYFVNPENNCFTEWHYLNQEKIWINKEIIK